MALTIKQLPLPRSPQRSSARRLPIRGVVAHHMTVIGNGRGLANEACRSIWRTREASAHYGIDGKTVAQFLPDSVAAWATADFEGNHGRINVEHANSSGGPQWRISADTLDTGARLFAELHRRHNLGRPVPNVTIQKHGDFFATACPGPWFGDAWAGFCAAVIRYYDNGTTNQGGFLMALSDKEQDEALTILRDLRVGRSESPRWHDGPGGRMMREIRNNVRTIKGQKPEVNVTLDASDIATEILDQLPADLAAQVVDELGKRVQR